MKITSPAFTDNAPVPAKYTCKGKNISPPLRFADIPDTARSLVLTVEDTDAAPKPWIHWFVFNIPPGTQMVGEGQVPAGGMEGYANGGDPGWEGPCPIYFKGIHHYRFNLFALDTTLGTQENITKEDIEAILQEHTVGQAHFTGIAEGTGEKA